MAQVPTILIGLGGIGSFIVDEVFGMIPEDQRGHVAVHAFDTNVNDIGKLRHMKAGHNVTQTSTSWTVEEYLNKAHSSVKDWFPHEQREVLNKSLTDGAGQIRAVSRLAYRAAMQSGKLEGLQASIRHIFQESGKSTSSSARVMIVCSVVGGTGAGIFQQTAMYLRDVLRNDFQRRNVLIRGAFVLPDILVGSNAITGDEVQNIRANGYASIKELNAITRNASSNPDSDIDVAIELEYRPDQMDSDGRLNHVISSYNLPFNYCFLYDFENTEKNNIKYVGNYLRQVIRSTFLDLFSPISDDRFSRQDNQILTVVREQGLNRFCGSGVSTLIYPYHDVVHYSGLKWVSESLGKDWLKVDDEFESEFRQYEKDLKNNIPRERPDRGERYRWILDNMAKDDKPQPFFKSVYRSLHSLGKKGEIGDPKAYQLLDSIIRHMEDIVTNDEKLNDAKGQCILDEGRLEDRDRAKNAVNNMEESLYDYEQVIRKFLQEAKNFVVNQVMIRDCDAENFFGGQDYHLNTWILGKPDPMHPVAVRYFLYQLDALLEERIALLAPTNKNLSDFIKKYPNAYDDPATEDEIETPDDRLREALKQKLLKRFMGNKFKEFVEEYTEKSLKHLKNLNRFKTDRLQELVFVELRKLLAQMIEQWERYFHNLRDVNKSMDNELRSSAKDHEKGEDPSKVFVMASQNLKDMLWENIRTLYAGDELPTEISAEIYKGQYSRLCKKHSGNYITEQSSEKVEEMFRQDVLEYCKNKLYKEDSLDMNVVRATNKEAQLKGIDENKIDDYIAERIQLLDNLSRPWVPAKDDANEINAWGVHPECLKEISGESRNELFDGTDLVENEAFSRFEINRNRTMYGMVIEDFPKFSSGLDNTKNPGVYFQAYKDRIKQLMEQGNTVTPHLDKRWHLPAYLPELSAAQAERDTVRIDKALVMGLMMGSIQSIEEFGSQTWLFSDSEGSRLVKLTDGSNAGEYLHLLHEALRHNPVVVDKVLEHFNNQMAEDIREHKDDVENYKFFIQSAKIHYGAGGSESNLMDLILRYPDGNPNNAELLNTSLDLFELAIETLIESHTIALGAHRAKPAKEKAKALIEKYLAESKVYEEADENGRLFRSWNDTLHRLTKD